MNLNVVSLFDGMSCCQLALNKLGIKPTKYFASEIDKYAMQVTMANFPNTIQIGDVRNINSSNLGFVHILAGGSPCQSFSFAGKRKGMATKCEVEILSLSHYLELKEQNFEFEGQSYLFWEYMRILEELRVINPNIKFLLENVLMGEKWQKILTRAIGINPIQINSALLSAQNRNRLYWTNIGAEAYGLFGDLVCKIPQPKDKGILLKDILETDVDDKYFLSEKALKFVLDETRNKKKYTQNGSFSEKSLPHLARNQTNWCGDYIVHNTMPRSSKTGKGGTGPLSSADGKTYCLDTGNTNAIEIQCVAMRGRNPDNPKSRVAGLPTEQQLEPRNDGKTNCLTSVQKDNLVISGTLRTHNDGKGFREVISGKEATIPARAREDGSGQNVVSVAGNIRRLTPIECERLQTVPEKEFFCIFTLCKEEIKNYVNVVEQNPKLLKLALSVENQELLEFVKRVNQNTKQKNLQTKSIALQNVDIPTKKQTKKYMNHNLQELNIIANNVEKNVMSNCQNQEEVFVIPNVFINITEERITHYGKEELLQKDSPYTIQMNGNNPLKLYGKEIMQLVKDVSVETMNPKDMNFIYTTLSGLNIKNIELMLAIFYLFAKNATIGFIQDTTNQGSLSIQFRIKNGYTAHVSDTQRYKMLGNGWTISVISFILSHLPKNNLQNIINYICLIM